MEFVSPDIIHRYIRKLSKSGLDIEFTEDYQQIENSNKSYIIWNPYGYLSYPNQAYKRKHEFYKQCRLSGRPYYVVERGALPNSIFIDNKGFLCESRSYNELHWNKELTAEQNEKVETYIDEIVNDDSTLEKQHSIRLTRENFFEKLNVNTILFKKIVFVPFQLHSDTVIKLWSDWIEGDTRNFISMIKEIAEENPDILFICKNHPIEEDKSFMVTQETHNIKIADKLHYKDCISYCDSIVSINSGVGLQAMMWKKPTILVGHAFYQFDDINYKANDKKEVLRLILKAKEPNWEKVKRFIYYLRYVFYSFCDIKQISKRATEPVLFERIRYEDAQGQEVILENQGRPVDIIKVLFEFLGVVPEACLMKLTCLECIALGGIDEQGKQLWLGIKLTREIINKLQDKGFLYTDNKFIKDKIIVNIESMPRQTKVMSLYGEQVNVPMPVVRYLMNLYGKNWKFYKSNPQKKSKEALQIAYSFNLHGWVFEFESLYYKKYSNLNIIPILEKDLKNLDRQNCDMVVIPSAWHYRDLERNGTIKYLRSQGIRIIAQYNSHIPTELDYCVRGADLVMTSSPMLYNEVKQKHDINNLICFPHFVDIEYFKPIDKYNNFVLGWSGNFENTYKRPHIMEAIMKESFNVKLKTNYRDSLQLHGKQQGMPEYYNSIDILLITSKSEGTPMPLLEAMACGKMVLSTNVGIASLVLSPECIINGKTDEEITQNFIAKLNELKQHPETVIMEGINNRSMVERYFSWKENVSVLDEIYTRLQNYELNRIKTISDEFVKKIKNRI